MVSNASQNTGTRRPWWSVVHCYSMQFFTTPSCWVVANPWAQQHWFAPSNFFIFNFCISSSHKSKIPQTLLLSIMLKACSTQFSHIVFNSRATKFLQQISKSGLHFAPINFMSTSNAKSLNSWDRLTQKLRSTTKFSYHNASIQELPKSFNDKFSCHKPPQIRRATDPKKTQQPDQKVWHHVKIISSEH